MSTLVMGIGNLLLTDEGIGIHVIRYLRQQYPNRAEYVDGGTLSFTLLPLITSARNLIVIDAAQFQAAAGSCHCWLGAELDAFLTTHKATSVHEVSLFDLFNLAQLTACLPQHRALFGIQPSELSWGDTPTPQLSAQIPSIAAQVIALMDAWEHDSVVRS